MAYLLVFLGAGIGGALRHSVNVAAYRFLGSAWRLFLTTGILGGFTTFSAFSLDTALLIERGQSLSAAVYVGSSAVGSIGALFVGRMIVRSLA